MTYSESEPDSNVVINSASNFIPTFFQYKSESESEPDFSSVVMNLGICIFYIYIYIYIWTPLNKTSDGFLSILITESIAMQAM